MFYSIRSIRFGRTRRDATWKKKTETGGVYKKEYTQQQAWNLIKSVTQYIHNHVVDPYIYIYIYTATSVKLNKKRYTIQYTITLLIHKYILPPRRASIWGARDERRREVVASLSGMHLIYVLLSNTIACIHGGVESLSRDTPFETDEHLTLSSDIHQIMPQTNSQCGSAKSAETRGPVASRHPLVSCQAPGMHAYIWP